MAKRMRIVITIMIMIEAGTSAASAQTRGVRDTATAYGARLNARGAPVTSDSNRINSRVASRIDTRLSLRVERYRPDSSENPVAAFEGRSSDNARVGTSTTLSPLSRTSSSVNAALPIGSDGQRAR